MGYPALLIGIGLAGGFVAGLLGLGGSILLVPLLLGTPRALGYEPLPMGAVAAISLVHVAFAAGAGVLLHSPEAGVLLRSREQAPALAMGLAGGMAALLGGFLSPWLPDATLLLLFALAATVATGLLLAPRRPAASGARAIGARWAGPAAAGVAGLATGVVGAAGGLLLTPFLERLLRSPEAQGTVMRIALVSALTGLAGKLLTGQVPLGLAAALVVGTLPGTWWGGEVSGRLNPRSIRWAALAAATMATLWVWSEALPRFAFRSGSLYLVAGGLVSIWVWRVRAAASELPPGR